MSVLGNGNLRIVRPVVVATVGNHNRMAAVCSFPTGGLMSDNARYGRRCFSSERFRVVDYTGVIKKWRICDYGTCRCVAGWRRCGWWPPPRRVETLRQKRNGRRRGRGRSVFYHPFRRLFRGCGLTGFYGAAIVGEGKNVTTNGGSAYVFVYFPGAGSGWCGVPV